MNSNNSIPKIIPAPIVKEAINGGILLKDKQVTVVVPASANLKHYDLLTINWVGLTEGQKGKSYPLPITKSLAGKEYVYTIPLAKIKDRHDHYIKIWYSFHQVGSHQTFTSLTLELRTLVYPVPATKELSVDTCDAAEPEELDLAISGNRTLDEIAYAKIHPGIGVGRVGNSQNEFYIGPEYANEPPPAFGATRDSTGAIKRQAARFRVYGYNKQGVAIAELTPDIADIKWGVELANKKSAWYQFDLAMDIPEARPVKRRNPLIAGAQRKSLEIRPSVKTISGTNSDGVQFDDGNFKGVPVNLGELRTDAQGRLLVLGGHGKAASPSGAPLLVINAQGKEENFNNSVDWYDDISDGPVSAQVSIKGKNIPVTDAWVIIGPPDYAPGIVPFRSLYDMIKATSIEAGLVSPRKKTSYTKDILPLLLNLANLQWVNVGFAQIFGLEGSFEINAGLLTSLRKPDCYFKRFDVYAKFRSPDDVSFDGGNELKWPQLYGDGLDSIPFKDVGGLLPVSPHSYEHLANFVLSDFVDDLVYDESLSPGVFPHAAYAQPVDKLPVAERPATLDEGPLSYCCADAFHPGCELTWNMRHASLYSEFMRIKRRRPHEQEKDYGDVLTPEQALAADGPLHAQGAGDLTRWMAMPWQGDTARCRSGYDKEFHPYLPSFWPAKVPNEVLSEETYNYLLNDAVSVEDRTNAFNHRDYWQRAFLLEGLSNESVMQATIDRFDELGIVQRRPIPPIFTWWFDHMFVEQLKPGMPPLHAAASAFSARVDGATVDHKATLLKQMGWTEEEWEKFRRTR
ncbi:LodA/GoxA family CTQ-dependent oxidase [Pectobacterium versatile]|uniref:LodA/GoxA family CTQ-dependent oxidase n=1 Tax=Pectobacterium versatile TaxID=2488639 RepID=UPI001CCFCABD|nr:LodA/GoxA family CTQ-dependent oxidase [Pectobacterium versatile]